MSKIVIALGGNALGKNPEEQLDLLESVAKIIVDLVNDLCQKFDFCIYNILFENVSTFRR